MNKLKLLSMLFGGISLVGCSTATPYQALGTKAGGIVGGGYESYQIKKDMFMVSARGNGFTDVKRVNDIAMRRAADECKKLDNSYTKIQMVDKGDKSDNSTAYITTPTTTYHTGTYNTYGSYGTFSGTSTGSTITPMNIRKHQTKLIIKCVKNDTFGIPINEIYTNTSYLVEK